MTGELRVDFLANFPVTWKLPYEKFYTSKIRKTLRLSDHGW